MNPRNYLNQLFSYGVQALQNSDYTLAQKTFFQILKEFPDHPDAYNLLGVVFSKKEAHEKALDYFSRAVEKNPDNPNYYLNRGMALVKAGNLQEAINDYKKATEVNPEFAEGFFSLGNARKMLGDWPGALEAYQRAINIQPQHALALYNLGNTHLEAGNYKSAIEFLERAVKVNPQFPRAHNNLGIALQEWDRWEEAEVQFRSALEYEPSSADACRNLAQLCEKQGRVGEAGELYSRLSEISPGNPWLPFKQSILSPVIAESGEAILRYRSGLKEILDQWCQNPPRESPFDQDSSDYEPPSNLIYQGGDDKDLKKKFAALFVPHIPHEEITRQSREKIHLGFVVTSGHEGVFLKCMRGIIEHLSREKFRITVVCGIPNGERILRPVLREAGIAYLSVPNKVRVAADLILKSAIDVLNYWEVGTDSLNYYLPFWRLAPVQCTSWGWPVTSGISTLDYFISCEGLEPEGADKHYTEKLVRLKRLPVYYYKPPVPDVLPGRAEFDLLNADHIYMVNQNLRKVHPEMDTLIVRILERDPVGKVIFIADKQSHVTGLLKKRLEGILGPHAERMLFMPRMTQERYLGLLTCTDVVLDTLYYTGGANTTYDCFAAGTPVVTWPTEYHRGRYTSAAYQQIGVTDCIAATKEEYVEKALRLGTDAAYRKEISVRILNAADAIFNDDAAVQELETFFSDAVKDRIT